MISDKLMPNDSKTEILLVGTRQQLRKVDLDALSSDWHINSASN